jgi:hypothetical protein
MRGFGGGFASGLQAGSQSAARAYQAKIDAENQEFLQSERAREIDYRGKQREAAAPSELTEQTGLMVTPAGEGAKPFYIPQEAVDKGAGDVYARAGYTVGEAPTRYQEARAKGGATLGQASYDIGPEPARGLAADWDKGMTKRQMQVAREYGKASDAAAYGLLDTQELQREQLKGEIEAQPGKRKLTEVQTAGAEQEVISKTHANEVAKREEQWWTAGKSEDSAIAHYNDNFKDGSKAKVIEKNGMRQMVQVKEDGTTVPLGAPYKSWAEGGRQQILGNIDSLAKEQYKLDITHKNKMEELAAQTKAHLQYASIIAGNKKLVMSPDQKTQFTALETKLSDLMADPETNAKEIEKVGLQLHVLGNTVSMANGQPPKAFPQLRAPGRNWGPNEAKALMEARALLEQSPQFQAANTPAKRAAAYTAAGLDFPAGAKGGGGGGNSMLNLEVDPDATKPPPAKAGRTGRPATQDPHTARSPMLDSPAQVEADRAGVASWLSSRPGTPLGGDPSDARRYFDPRYGVMGR